MVTKTKTAVKPKAKQTSKVSAKTSKSKPVIKSVKSKPAKKQLSKTKPAIKTSKTEIPNKKLSKGDKNFVSIFLILSIVFLVVGTIGLLVNQKMIFGIECLITAILFSKANRKISENKISTESKDNPTKILFALGFLFSAIGPSINPGVWASGTILFSVWLFTKH